MPRLTLQFKSKVRWLCGVGLEAQATLGPQNGRPW